jgi:Glu-tRNA(Gln) amidotransferase subunit E-like FAD-binding protein
MNFKELEFKCGLEIHAQLDTGKLFCRCDSKVYGENKDFSLVRKIRAVAGETGKIDIAAAYQMKKDKTFIYTGDRKLNCLVELDDEPPQEINEHAVKVALQVAKLLNCDIIDEIEVMRKIVVDGSNVSGFQRTMLVGMDGHIETSKGEVKIEILCLEEESAQKIKENKDYIEYNLDRLGVPLLEIATDASIKDPDHAKEVAEIIGMIVKSTGKARKGIGTIRQDVNISSKGHPRIEIKGFQDVKSMPQTIEKEVERQQKEVKENKKCEQNVRKAESDGTTSFLRPMPGASRMYPETDVSPFVPDIKGIKIPKLISEKKEEIQKLGLSKDLAKLIASEGKSELLSEFANKFKNIKVSFIAETISPTLKELSRNGLDTEKINSEILESIFYELNKGNISKNSIRNILEGVCQGKNLEKLLSQNKNIDDKELETQIKQIIKKNKEAPFNALMGLTMKKFKGKADGKKISEILRRLSK